MEEGDKSQLPLDIIGYEILTRLPVKTLSRFKCVSKSWSSLISHPHFQKKHLRRSEQNPLLLVTGNEYNTTVVCFSTYNKEGGCLLREVSKIFPKSDQFSYGFRKVTLYPIQSCLGLICLRNFSHGDIIVCNLSTEEMITLPPRPSQYLDICVGFGYTTFTCEFKVVRFFCNAGDDVCRCEVYTLGASNGWREARTLPPFDPDLQAPLALLHGALHFLPDYAQLPLLDHCIAAFDLDTEKYREIPLPRSYFEEKFLIEQSNLTESRGSLYMVFDCFASKRMLQIWLLKDYQNAKWVKEYNIDLFSAHEFCYPLVITNDSIWLNIDYSSTQNRELCCYNIKEKQIVKRMGTNCSAIYYVESFVSLGTRGHYSV